MSSANLDFARTVVAILTFVAFTCCASAQDSTGPRVIFLLQLAGDREALAQIGSCLASKLSRMPDVEIASGPTDGIRFIVDVIATKGSLASVVVAETFPVEQYRVRIKGARTAMPCWPVSAPIRCFDCTSSCRAVLAKPFV